MKEQSLQYLINLVKQVVEISDVDYRRAISSYELPDFSMVVSYKAGKKVKKMTPETLGRIAAYGLHPRGLTGWADGSEFIRQMGIKDVHPNDFEAKKPGRELLEEIAIATIVATAYDILHQDFYRDSAKYEAELDRQFDRAQHAILHGRTTI